MNGGKGYSLGLALTAGTCLLLFCGDAPAAVEAEAIPGSPFGVGRVTVSLVAGDVPGASLQTGGYLLTEEDGRVFYPAFTTGIVRRLLGEILGVPDDAPAASVTAYFLFRGEEPLQLTLATPRPTTVEVTPRAQPPRFQTRLLRSWWREYNAVVRKQASVGDYPPLVETYLTTVLAQRMGLTPPLLSQLGRQPSSQPRQTLELLAGVESLRAATMRDSLLRRGGVAEAADQPVPADIAWRPQAIPATGADVDIEPIAMHVPEECFYIRFGQFANYIWMDKLAKEFGGDISRMINLRGHDAHLNQRMQRQLALKQTVLAELFGGTIIADVAIIGRDTYLREGAAVGVMFQARNNLLKAELAQQRAAALKENENNGASLETIDVAGHEVSFLSTSDNRLRSFYAVDGNFHLVTTSQEIVRRFYEAGQNRASLGGSSEFRHARSVMPTSRDDTIFAYMSSAFFRGLVGPQYQIELARRLQSITDMELLQMAELTAAAEGHLGRTIDDMVAAQLLPVGFGYRADGSRLIVEDDRLLDSLRGARGSFTPIPDVEIHAVTRSEAAQYASRASFYRDQWTEMDPLMVGVKRFALDRQGRERIVIDAHVSLSGEGKYGRILSSLGPPTTQYIVMPPDDVISMQAMLRGGLTSPAVPPHHLFFGVQDDTPLVDLRPTGLLQTLRTMQSTPAYLGAWPKPGFLDQLPLGLAGEPDALGYSRLPLGLWRRQGGGFSVLSFDRRVLAETTPQLRVEEADTAAQVRLHVADLSQSKLAGQINAMLYERARQTSVGNVRLLHALTQQLHVPPEKALATAQRLLDVELLCALEGEYRPVEYPGGLVQWESTRWPDSGGASAFELPEDYTAPLLRWFRGLDAELIKQADRMVLHAQLDMQREPDASIIKLPLFNIFGGGNKPRATDDAQPPGPVIELPAPKTGPRRF